MAPLYQAPEDLWIDPEQAKNSELVLNAKNKWPQSTFDRVLETIDLSIDAIVKSDRAEFVWMDAGALIGAPNQAEPHGDKIAALWTSVSSLVSNDPDPVAVKIIRKTAGVLIKWRTSLRPEKYWLVSYLPINRKDPVTGEEIYASKYWINPSYPAPQRQSGFSIDDLKGRFR